MEIGKKIKERRKQLGLTQDMLAKKLHVARTTVANWEQEKNYPDMKLIKEISNILEIPIDELIDHELNKTEKVKINNKITNNKSVKIIIAAVLLIFVIVVFVGSLYNKFEYRDIDKASQIVKAEISQNDLFVKVDLPIYRSAIGGVVYTTEKSDSIEIEVGTKVDLSMKNEENVKIKLLPEMFAQGNKNIKYIYFTTNESKRFTRIKVKND